MTGAKMGGDRTSGERTRGDRTNGTKAQGERMTFGVLGDKMSFFWDQWSIS
jgi:hypothetical protein